MATTIEMKTFFAERTHFHISHVHANLLLLQGYRGLAFEVLQERGLAHDHTKFTEENLEPYTWLSWWHKCRISGTPISYPEGVEEKVKRAVHSHLHSEPHHLEYFSSPDEMTLLDLAEMVCDWTAIQEEYGRSSAKEWANAEIGRKFMFNEENARLIHEIIDELDSRKASQAASSH
mmetsp:Transcript_3554/g.7622  ORF Transcript_3554/g.7622 Transcript_3554/m.7622 type:complete len:176 (+) Transcript_3554:318-845(+)